MVDENTPTGDHGLALLVTEDGAEHRLGWLFRVVEPVATPQTSDVAAYLTVERPLPGEVFVQGGELVGTTSSRTVEYRLIAGDVVLAQGSVDAVDGAFSTTVAFENRCCIEMMFEVFDPQSGIALQIPLALPEPA